ncbi:hypothetical protein T484DRAFT_1627860 [Baffinella frigidus]|nr:hypothetical protein T484DRAFT_1627860 [Cryptophyta sp. CCMP2293]
MALRYPRHRRHPPKFTRVNLRKFTLVNLWHPRRAISARQGDPDRIFGSVFGSGFGYVRARLLEPGPPPCVPAWYTRTPEPEPRKAETRNPELEGRDPEPETRNPKTENRNPEPETRNPKTENRKPKTGTRNSEPEDRNPKAETRNPEPRTPNTKPQTPNPKP